MSKELEQNPEVKAVIEFNTKAAKNSPTPKAFKVFYRGLALATIIWALFIEPIFTDIPVHAAYETNKVLIALNAIVFEICRRFGWVVEGDRKTEV